jgi:hypothetical protein
MYLQSGVTNEENIKRLMAMNEKRIRPGKIEVLSCISDHTWEELHVKIDDVYPYWIRSFFHLHLLPITTIKKSCHT